MPPKPLTAEQPTFYLDQSTLSDAYRGLFVGRCATGEAQRDLAAWVGRVAREANLCLSGAHIEEMARWNEGPAMAAWLEQMPVVWMIAHHEMQRDEDEALVKRLAGVIVDPPSPFRGSLVAAIQESVERQDIDRVAGMLSSPTLVTAVRGRQGGDDHGTRAFVPNWLRMLLDDRAAAAARGVTPADLQSRLDDKWRKGLQRRALEAHKRLIDRLDEEYVVSGADLNRISDPFVEAYNRDPALLPTTTVIRAYSRGFEEHTRKRDPISKKTRNDFASAFWDLCHAASGASYCAVFTCDAFTARCLGDVRTSLGLAAPVVRGQSGEEFVSALRSSPP